MTLSINFNHPVELFEIFRIDIEDPITNAKSKQECGGRTLLGWEDVRMIRDYPYDDDWEVFPGEKFYLTLHEYHHDILILGNRQEFESKWIEFKLAFGIWSGSE